MVMIESHEASGNIFDMTSQLDVQLVGNLSPGMLTSEICLSISIQVVDVNL